MNKVCVFCGKKAINGIFTAFYYLCLLTIVPAVLFLLLKPIFLDFMPPSQLYSPIFIAILIIIYLSAIAGEFFYSRRRQKHTKVKPGPKPNMRRQIIVVVLILAIAVISIAVLNATMTYLNDRSLAKLLEQSRDNIIVDTPSDNVSQDRVNSTVGELQKQVNELRKEYHPKVNYVIKLDIYPSQSELRDKTGAGEGVGGTYRFDLVNRQHLISLVAEQAVPWFKQNNETRTTSGPGHEALHAVMTELVGPEKRNKIPLGFEEGLAQYESLRGYLNLRERSGRRDYLWSIKSQISHDQIGSILEVSAYPKGKLENDQLYLLSYEMVRYISHSHSSSTLLDTLDLVVEGKSFASAFRDATGQSMEQASYEWERWFFGVQH